MCYYFLSHSTQWVEILFEGGCLIFTRESTLVYRIDVQYKINVQMGKFLKNIKRAGQNRHAGGKFSGKSIIMQGENKRAGGN